MVKSYLKRMGLVFLGLTVRYRLRSVTTWLVLVAVALVVGFIVQAFSGGSAFAVATGWLIGHPITLVILTAFAMSTPDEAVLINLATSAKKEKVQS